MLRNSDMHIQGPQIHQFNNIAPRAIPRSVFKRDSTLRTTFDVDYLYPMFIEEILPGDDISIKMNSLVRLATPLKPIMDNLYLESFWFFVPNRLVWTNWEKFQGMRLNPTDSTNYTIPTLNETLPPMNVSGFASGSIYDYLTLPTLVPNLAGISALYNRAYELIFNEWFRDENLQGTLAVSTGDGPDDPATYGLRRRNKRKDYFTSALPWPQKGDPVALPIGGQAPVIFPSPIQSRSNRLTLSPSGTIIPTAIYTNVNSANNANILVNASGSNTTGYEALITGSAPGPTDAYANLAGSTPVTINALRQAALYQQILELDARGGTRYVESIYTRFGVISPDFRLQRPELIGQGSSRINVYAVAQTAASDTGSTPQGNLAAYGTGIINNDHGARYSATEHGMIIGLVNVRADLTYQQGINKMFLRSTRLEFYEPLLNGLGEQAIQNQELYATSNNTNNKLTFGYQERWSEYRYRQSNITGLFRSNVADSLDIWHLSQEFASTPTLNATFIGEQVPIDRVIAVPSEPSFLMDAHFSVNHVRPMPVRSNPGIDVL